MRYALFVWLAVLSFGVVAIASEKETQPQAAAVAPEANSGKQPAKYVVTFQIFSGDPSSAEGEDKIHVLPRPKVIATPKVMVEANKPATVQVGMKTGLALPDKPEPKIVGYIEGGNRVELTVHDGFGDYVYLQVKVTVGSYRSVGQGEIEGSSRTMEFFKKVKLGDTASFKHSDFSLGDDQLWGEVVVSTAENAKSAEKAAK